MSEAPRRMTPEHFIQRELRQSDGPERPSQPSLDPGASKDEIQSQAMAVIGEAEGARLGLVDGVPPLDIWDKVFVPHDDVTSTVLEREAVLLNLNNGRYYTLNRVGTAVWELMTGDRPLAEILSAICERFNVTEEVARQDLVALVTRLRQEKLIDERR
jgi:hypothetical protein